MYGGALCAAVLLALGWLPMRRNHPDPALWGGAWATAIWLSVGAAALLWLMVVQFEFEPVSAMPFAVVPSTPLRNFPFHLWGFFIALGLLPLGLLEGIRSKIGPVQTGLVWLCRPLVAGLAIYLALSPYIAPAPNPFVTPPPEPIAGMALIGFLTLWVLPIFALIAVLDPLAQRRPGATLPLGLWLVTAASSGCFLLFGHIQLALAAGGLAVALGGLVMLSMLQPIFSMARGGITLTLILLESLWAQAVYLTPIKGQFGCLALMAVGLGCLWLRELPLLAKRKPWQAAVLTLLLVAVPVGGSVGWAGWRYYQENQAKETKPEDTGGYNYGSLGQFESPHIARFSDPGKKLGENRLT